MLRRIVGTALVAVAALATMLVPASSAQAADGPTHQIWFGHSVKCLEPGIQQRGQLVQRTCADWWFNQRWHFDYAGADSDGVPFWRIRHDGLTPAECVTNGGDNRSLIIRQRCGVAGRSELWQLLPTGVSGYYYFRNAQNWLCITLPFGEPGRGDDATIGQWMCGWADGKRQFLAIS